jgi:hypothetical protein
VLQRRRIGAGKKAPGDGIDAAVGTEGGEPVKDRFVVSETCLTMLLGSAVRTPAPTASRAAAGAVPMREFSGPDVTSCHR